MIVTNEKIEVTLAMLARENMFRADAIDQDKSEIGVPIDPNDPGKGLEWINMFSLDEPDFDALELYFLNKQNQTQ